MISNYYKSIKYKSEMKLELDYLIIDSLIMNESSGPHTKSSLLQL